MSLKSVRVFRVDKGADAAHLLSFGNDMQG